MNLHDWLDAHRLGHLEETLRGAGVDLDVLPDLSEADLAGIGITLGDRKRLLRAVAAGTGTQPPTAPASERIASAPPPPNSGNDSAGRRQLTVMFCDLVGSTRLSETLDPEDLRGVLQTFYETVGSAVSAFGGHVEQYLGDGVLVFFGYPRAEEDAVTRAVRAGMAALEALAASEPMPGLRLKCRIGIATGPVVLGALMSESSTVVTGRTPNLAARLQACAEPGEMLLAPETARLAAAAFRLQRLPAVELKGIEGPITPWRVLGEQSPDTRLLAGREPGELIGREAETALLLHRWALASEGEPQAILLSGEAGIGKSRLAETLLIQARDAGARIVLWQCSPHFTHSALWPVARQLERMWGIDPLESAAARAMKIATAGIRDPLLQQLAGVSDAAPAGDAVSRKVGTEEAVLSLLRELAREQPLLLLVEDAHWIDPSTQEILRRALTELGSIPVLLMVNSRPEFRPDWGHSHNLTRLGLNRLGNRHSAELVAQVCAGHVLPQSVIAEVLSKTDGIPLFVEELTRTVLESDTRSNDPGAAREGALVVPSSLQDSLMARLDRLSGTRELAQAASVIGREFGHRLLAAIMQPLDGAKLAEAIEELLRSELVTRRGSGDEAVYVFKHALVRDTAYDSLLRGPRSAWHSRVARAIRDHEPHTAAQRPELLAYHLQEAGESTDARRCWGLAAEAAFARAALPEAARHVQSALALVADSPDALPEEQQLQMLLTHVMTQVEGYGSGRGIEAGRRAVALARQMGNPDLHVEAACGLGTLLVSSGRIRETVELFDAFDAASLSRLAPARRASRHWMLGVAALLSGNCALSVAELQESLGAIRACDIHERAFFIGGARPEIAILLWLERALEFAGRAEDAAACSEQAYALARDDAHAPSLAWSLQSRATALISSSGMDEARTVVAQLQELSRRFAIKPRIAVGLLLEGQLLLREGRVEQARARMAEGVSMWADSSPGLLVTNFAGTAARALAGVGDIEGVCHFLSAGEHTMATTEERSAEAELLRLRAWVAGTSGNVAQARTLLQAAIDIARRNGAGLFALRAGIDLARLEEGTPDSSQARATLREMCSEYGEMQPSVLMEATQLLGQGDAGARAQHGTQ